MPSAPREELTLPELGIALLCHVINEHSYGASPVLASQDRTKRVVLRAVLTVTTPPPRVQDERLAAYQTAVWPESFITLLRTIFFRCTGL
jgi:hypothetical protein